MSGCIVREPDAGARRQLEALLIDKTGMAAERAHELAESAWHVALASAAYGGDYTTDGLGCSLGEYRAALEELVEVLEHGRQPAMLELLNQNGCNQEELVSLAAAIARLQFGWPVRAEQLTPAARKVLLRVSRAKLDVVAGRPRQQSPRQTLARLLWQNWASYTRCEPKTTANGELGTYHPFMVTLAWLFDRFEQPDQLLDGKRIMRALLNDQGRIRKWVRAGKPARTESALSEPTRH